MMRCHSTSAVLLSELQRADCGLQSFSSSSQISSASKAMPRSLALDFNKLYRLGTQSSPAQVPKPVSSKYVPASGFFVAKANGPTSNMR